MAFPEDPTNRVAIRKDLVEYHGSVPFIASLSDLLPHGIKQMTHERLVIDSAQFNKPFLATQMTREVDLSGIVPNVVDTCHNPEEVEKILFPLAQEQIDAIRQQSTQNQIFETLEGKNTTPEAIAWLDSSLKHILQVLSAQRGSVSKSMQQKAYQALEVHGGKISYTPELIDGPQGKLVDSITSTYSCPPLPEESARILQALTPALLKRGSYYQNIVYPVNTPVGYLRQIGILGWPYLRSLVANIDKIKKTGSYDNDPMKDLIQNNP